VNLDYADIFRVRGHLYHAAMRAAPAARRLEFLRAFDRFAVSPGQSVLDLPAGGGYLKAHLPRGVDVTERELTPGFDAMTPVLGPGAWDLGRYDHVVCLAALHHIDDQPGFVARLAAHAAPSGTLHVADVRAGSDIARFLDGFVGRFNETGHEGRYLDPDALPLPPAMRRSVARVEEVDCPWHFDDEGQMLSFCGALFGLRRCSSSQLLDALAQIGIERHPQGVALQWRLLYVDIRPCDPVP
jgi:hypothetical protein